MIGRSISVEFVGLPGVGKTSLSRRVSEILKEKGLPVREPTYTLGHGLGRPPRSFMNSARKSLHVVREIVTHPGRSILSIGGLCGTRQRSLAILFKMTFNWLMVVSVLRGAKEVRAVHLFDQGVFQALWSIGLDAQAGAITKLGRVALKRVPLPDVVAVLEAGLPTIAQRLSSRGGHESRADAWRPEDAAVFTRSSALLEEVKTCVRESVRCRDGLRVLPIHNDRNSDLDANARRLATEIERMVGEEVT